MYYVNVKILLLLCWNYSTLIIFTNLWNNLVYLPKYTFVSPQKT